MNSRHINTIMHKELQGYFKSPLAYIVMTVFLVVTGWLFFSGFFLAGQATMRPFFGLLPWIFLFLIPAITMRLWAEEQKLGTLETLLTAPITPWEAVLGKFFASLAFLIITVLLSVALPVVLFVIGNPDWGVIVSGYLGAFFLGAAFLAIGLFVSSLTDSQIIAFIITAVILFILFVIGESFVLYSAPAFLVPIFKYLGMGAHFDSIARGVLDTRDILYYLLVIYFALHLNAMTITLRKWK